MSPNYSASSNTSPHPRPVGRRGQGRLPRFHPRTDEERVQNCGDVVARHQGETFYVTEKVDGASGTFYKKDGQFGVCSRNLELRDSADNTLWTLARQYNLADALPDGHAVQGEVVGPGVQGNPLRLPRHELLVFSVYDIRAGRYLNWPEMVEFCQRLGLKRVPLVSDQFKLDRDVAGLLAMAEGRARSIRPCRVKGWYFGR